MKLELRKTMLTLESFFDYIQQGRYEYMSDVSPNEKENFINKNIGLDLHS